MMAPETFFQRVNHGFWPGNIDSRAESVFLGAKINILPL
jgi:hypothetical protein